MEINVNGVRLYYEKVGAGAPLIMVHGNSEDHTIFHEAAALLKKKYTCYLVDSRGHGQSETVYCYDYAVMAKDMACFIEALELKDVTFYGFSDGGIIGLILASTWPELVRTLIVSGANTNPGAVKDRIYRLFKLLYHLTKDPLTQLMLEQPHITPEQLSRITARTLVLAGSKDLVKEEDTRLIAASIPGAQLKILPGEDHMSYIVHKDRIAELILEFTGQ